jgi:chloramphenicol-sensitive protein RarD
VPGEETLKGLAAAGAAFLTWGLLPLYWKLLQPVPAREILCHRIVWSFVFVGAIVLVQRRWSELARILQPRRNLPLILASSSLLAANWLTYIWGVNHGFVLQASMGYYINPLVNVLLGCVFFRDRLRPGQLAAVLLAAAGVLHLVHGYGQIPWISLILALSFGFYGLIRKVVTLQPLPGLLLESVCMGAPALAWLLARARHGSTAFGAMGPTTDFLLVGAGAATAVPLLLFAFGARRLRLAEVGIMQYVAPTCMFLLGVFVFDEPFTPAHLVAFLCIWTGIGIYTAEGFLFRRLSSVPAQRGPAAEAAPEPDS